MRVKRSIDIMTNRIVTILANNNPTILLYGSVTLDDFRLGWSDIDILCLTEKPIDEAQANKLVSLRQVLMDEYQGNPYFRLFEGGFISEKAFFNKENDIVVYWGTGGQKIIEQYRIDPFSAIEIVEHGMVLYGKDLRSKIPYPTEKEIHDAVENHYNTIRKYAQTANKRVTSAGWFLDIARCLYTLKTGKVIAKTAAAEWALSERLVPNIHVMQRVIKIRKNPELYISDMETLEWIGTLGPFVQEFAGVLERELLKKKDKPTYLYHGSQHKTDILTPHTASGLPEENGTECGVYAYENIDDVLPFTLAIRPYSNGRKSFHVDDYTGIITISAGVFDETAPGYIYKMASDNFEKLDAKQWLSRSPVVPIEIITVDSKDVMNRVILTGSAKEVKDIANSIAYCGLVCRLCHLAYKCDGCRSENNCCGSRKTDEGCYQYNCCTKKGLNGCWECDIAPCDKGMFSAGHDIRLRAFVNHIKEKGKDELAERLYFNMQNGIYYGHGKDYDGLGSIYEVIKKLEG